MQINTKEGTITLDKEIFILYNRVPSLTYQVLVRIKSRMSGMFASHVKKVLESYEKNKF